MHLIFFNLEISLSLSLHPPLSPPRCPQNNEFYTVNKKGNCVCETIAQKLGSKVHEFASTRIKKMEESIPNSPSKLWKFNNGYVPLFLAKSSIFFFFVFFGQRDLSLYKYRKYTHLLSFSHLGVSLCHRDRYMYDVQ